MGKSSYSDEVLKEVKPKVLILDDEEIIRDLLEHYLRDDYTVYGAKNGQKALEILDGEDIRLALVDFNMPVMNGTSFIEAARKKYPDIAYIIMSGISDIDIAIEALHHGVLDFIQKPFRGNHFLHKVVHDALEKQNLLLENKKYKENLELMVKERTNELLQSRSRIIGILSRAAELKDYETGQHFIRVSQYSKIIAKGLALEKDRVEIIEQAAPVHDIGKIGIPEKLLLKHDKLTNSEFEEMKKHCIFGLVILNSQSLDALDANEFTTAHPGNYSSDDLLETASKIAMYHHERIDGSGYPEGLKGSEIPLEAKIVAVADVYDALGSERSYKKAWTEKKCQKFICENSGILFDSDVVKAFIDSIDHVLEVKTKYKDIAYRSVYSA